MTDFADYLEGEIIDWMAGGEAFPSAPSTIYVALHTGAPGDDAASNEVSTSSTGYSRQGLANPGDWTQPSADTAENTAIVTFGPATSDWGDVSHVSLWDAQTGGNALWAGDLDDTRTVLTDDEVQFDANDISVSVD